MSRWQRFAAWWKAGGWKYACVVPAVLAGILALLRVCGGGGDKLQREADEHKGRAEAFGEQAAEQHREADAATARADAAHVVSDAAQVDAATAQKKAENIATDGAAERRRIEEAGNVDDLVDAQK